MAFSIDAPAKVNLCLAVKYPPQDGYHALDSVFQTLSLHDTLTFEVAPGVPEFAEQTQAGTPVCLDCGPLDLPVRDNLVFKALDRAEQALGQAAADPGMALKVQVNKRIPAGGGLGGGSSDAAAAIKAYAKLAGADPLDERLLAVARGLGADVAFFLYGGAALMAGRGDVLERRLPDFPLPIVLMGEQQGISTAEAYRAFDAAPPAPGDARKLADMMENLQADLRGIAQLCTNNLEPAACAAQPRLAQRVAAAKGSPHVLNALVTGSGSTSYAICRSKQAAREFEREIAPLCSWTYIAD